MLFLHSVILCVSGVRLTLQKIAIWMSKNCQKLDIFSKNWPKMTIFDTFWTKCQVLANLLTFKWQFSGGSASNPKPYLNFYSTGLFGLLLPVLLYTGLGLMVVSLVWCIAVGFYKKEINQPINLKEELALSHEYTVTVTTTDTSAVSDSMFLSDVSRTTHGTSSSDSPRDYNNWNKWSVLGNKLHRRQKEIRV